MKQITEESAREYMNIPVKVEAKCAENEDFPVCPKCGNQLVPSDNPEYVWQCYECDEDFYSFEI